MPTGYTAEVANDQSFEDFVLGCARAFGPCIHQRDEKAGPAKLREEDTFYQDSLKEAEARLEELQNMSTAEKVKFGESRLKDRIAAEQKLFNDKIILKGKYEGMIQKVLKWNPPTPAHLELKKFMISQLEDSIKYDCDTKYHIDELSNLSKYSPEDLYQLEIKYINSNIKRYREQIQKRQGNTESSNRWIIDLYNSLGLSVDG